MRTVACAVGLWRLSFSILPIVKYTGHAFLSPQKVDKCVLLVERMIAAIIDPMCNGVWLPLSLA